MCANLHISLFGSAKILIFLHALFYKKHPFVRLLYFLYMTYICLLLLTVTNHKQVQDFQY